VTRRTKLECAAVVVSTKTDGVGRFAFTLSAGHYRLVIGAIQRRISSYETVHDSIVLTGGSQHLVAPDLPSIRRLYAFGSQRRRPTAI
jgi:hypothetical protein